jgi:hypothetical protein
MIGSIVLPRVRLMIGSILPAAVAAVATGVWVVLVVVMSVVMSVPTMSVRLRRCPQPQLISLTTAISTVMMAAALTVSEVIMMML